MDKVTKYMTPVLWGVIVMGVIAALLFKSDQGINIETNVLALLPETEQDPLIEQTISQFNATLSQRHLIVLGSSHLDDAIAAADEIVDSLGSLPGVAEVEYRFEKVQQRELISVYLPYQAMLLDEQTRKLLQSQGGKAYLNQTIQLLYSPLSPVSSSLLSHDPLLLFYRFANSLLQGEEQVTLHDGVLTAEFENQHYVLINLKLTDSPFSLQLQKEFLPALDQQLHLLRGNNKTLEILNVGMVRYARAGVESARQEISTIGFGSVAGVVLLLWVVFRSPLPLVASLLPIGTGFLAAFTACQWLFGSVHLLTLVFGVSLIGISIDYSFHFFCDRMSGDSDWNGKRGIHTIFNGITLGLVTSVLGYAGLCFAPFPGMQQMALFSTVGLSAAYITVVCLFPWMAPCSISGKKNRYWLALAAGFANALNWPRRWTLLLLMGLLVLGISGISRLTVDDDIRLLQSAPAQMKAEEQRVSAIVGRGLSNQFLLVEGDSPEHVLQREEAVIPVLETLLTQRKLARFDALSQRLPSAARQRENLNLVKRHLLDEQELFEQYADSLGMAADVIDNVKNRYLEPNPNPNTLSLETWLASSVAKPWRNQWLGETGRGYASVIVLYAADRISMEALERHNSGVTFVDKVTDISTLLAQYRQRTALIVMVSYILIYGLLCFRYQPTQSLRIMIPLVMAVILALGSLGWIGQALNIFHLLALLLVLGIGVDYTLFLEEGSTHRDSTLLAILLSAITTLLSFGLLGLSSTPAVAAFGVTVSVGIVVCLVLAPLLCGKAKTSCHQ